MSGRTAAPKIHKWHLSSGMVPDRYHSGVPAETSVRGTYTADRYLSAHLSGFLGQIPFCNLSQIKTPAGARWAGWAVGAPGDGYRSWALLIGPPADLGCQCPPMSRNRPSALCWLSMRPAPSPLVLPQVLKGTSECLTPCRLSEPFTSQLQIGETRGRLTIEHRTHHSGHVCARLIWPAHFSLPRTHDGMCGCLLGGELKRKIGQRDPQKRGKNPAQKIGQTFSWQGVALAGPPPPTPSGIACQAFQPISSRWFFSRGAPRLGHHYRDRYRFTFAKGLGTRSIIETNPFFLQCLGPKLAALESRRPLAAEWLRKGQKLGL